MKKKRFLLSLTLLLISPAWAQSPATSHEERVVRNTYAKVSYMAQVKVIGDLAKEGWTGEPNSGDQPDRSKLARKLEDARVTFTLTDFKVGPLEQINQDRWFNFITIAHPPMQVLKFQPATQTWNDPESTKKGWLEAQAGWEDVLTYPPRAMKLLDDKTVAYMIETGGKQFTYPDVTYARYAAFEVTATFQGKTVGPYKAIFLFGHNAAGREVVATLGADDIIIGA